MRPTGSKAKLEQRRRLGVALHRSGLSIREVAKQLGCAPGSVSRWTKMFEEGGDAALDPIPNAGGKARLGEVELAQLRALLHLGARASGFSTELWTLKRVRAVIAQHFGVEYSISNVHGLLDRMGYSSQKALGRARQRDVEAVEQFRRKEWPKVKKSPPARTCPRPGGRERVHAPTRRAQDVGAEGTDA